MSHIVSTYLIIFADSILYLTSSPPVVTYSVPDIPPYKHVVPVDHPGLVIAAQVGEGVIASRDHLLEYFILSYKQ